jgi:hypothetical protein
MCTPLSLRMATQNSDESCQDKQPEHTTSTFDVKYKSVAFTPVDTLPAVPSRVKLDTGVANAT